MLAPKNESLAALHREIALYQAAENIAAGPTNPKGRSMPANTGARGFAAMMKAEAEAMRAEFSKLHDETKAEIDQMKGHLQTGRDNLSQMKSDNKELREALGLDNEAPVAS